MEKVSNSKTMLSMQLYGTNKNKQKRSSSKTLIPNFKNITLFKFKITKNFNEFENYYYFYYYNYH